MTFAVCWRESCHVIVDIECSSSYSLHEYILTMDVTQSFCNATPYLLSCLLLRLNWRLLRDTTTSYPPLMRLSWRSCVCLLRRERRLWYGTQGSGTLKNLFSCALPFCLNAWLCCSFYYHHLAQILTHFVLLASFEKLYQFL